MSEVPVDASTLINFLILDRVDLLGSLAEFDFRVPAEVAGEILDETQRKRLDAGLASGSLGEIQLSSPAELATYARLRERLGRGESTRWSRRSGPSNGRTPLTTPRRLRTAASMPTWGR